MLVLPSLILRYFFNLASTKLEKPPTRRNLPGTTFHQILFGWGGAFILTRGETAQSTRGRRKFLNTLIPKGKCEKCSANTCNKALTEEQVLTTCMGKYHPLSHSATDLPVFVLRGQKLKITVFTYRESPSGTWGSCMGTQGSWGESNISTRLEEGLRLVSMSQLACLHSAWGHSSPQQYVYTMTGIGGGRKELRQLKEIFHWKDEWDY